MAELLIVALSHCIERGMGKVGGLYFRPAFKSAPSLYAIREGQRCVLFEVLLVRGELKTNP